MRKPVILILVCFLLTAAVHAQNVKAPAKDTSKAYRPNDRLKTAGPKNGWPNQAGKPDSIKANKDSLASIRRTIKTKINEN